MLPFANTAGTQGARYFRLVSGVPRMGLCVPWIMYWICGYFFARFDSPLRTWCSFSLSPSLVSYVVHAILFKESAASMESRIGMTSGSL